MCPHRFAEDQPFAFLDRLDAGRFLAQHLAQYKDQNALVLAIPRGGVPVAAEVARALNAELDIIVACKLGAPFNEELAFGAVTSNGGRFIDWDLAASLEISHDQIEHILAATADKALRQERGLRGDVLAKNMTDRLIILIDDGLATGATMRAAARSIRQAKPTRLVIAVPVGSPQACFALGHEADEVICPRQPLYFYAVGAYYKNFEPVDDAEIIEILQAFQAD